MHPDLNSALAHDRSAVLRRAAERRRILRSTREQPVPDHERAAFVRQARPGRVRRLASRLPFAAPSGRGG
ncbi:MAG TPA: hypothetical protein VNY84_06445 [Acidimicrobiales bacterium]|jgi:hypothetical protein|nr:hypothetical protein [Acidimicrobiales bacterium]